MLRSILAGAVILLQVPAVNAIEVKQPMAVVELFTSQGCHSCPVADALIGEFAKDNDILGLSWHVDYWDYLGWKDTFGSKENTQRQHRYARSLQERQVYTPQVIINGRTHTSGARRTEIHNIIKYFDQDDKGMLVPVNVDLSGESLKISVDMNASAKDATLYMVFFSNKEQVKIERGENGGKTIDYHHVVREIQPLGMVKTDGLQMDYPLVEMKRSGADSCALILQKTNRAGDPAEIIGATLISDL